MIGRSRPSAASRALGPVLVASLLFAACVDESAVPVAPAPDARAAIAPGDGIREVLRRNTPSLMSRAGIIGAGIGLQDGAPAIVVYAVTPTAVAQAKFPPHLSGHPLRAVVTGLIMAGDINDPTSRERPAPNGFSVGHPDITAGTLGAKVSDGTSVYILSNNHVLANSNDASIGDPALQPGPFDGGTSADQIGTLADFEPIRFDGSDNTMDAAIAVVNGADLLGATPDYAYGAPGTNVQGATLNLAVQKFGRTTGLTHGTVAETDLTVSVCYEARGFFCTKSATFTDQIGITPGDFSAGGDSGSLIVTDDSNKNPVGLLFAGSSTRTIANPIGPVMSRFGIAIDNSTGDGGGDDPPPDPDPTDDPPSAAFTYSCGNTATCNFSDQSSDDFGVVSWSWSFGDGATSTAQNPSHTYGSVGSYTVTLTVTDGADQSDSASATITCLQRGRVRCS
ncbi:MAG: PKD domain-containing protein [Longimicrobiales bacterium]